MGVQSLKSHCVGCVVMNGYDRGGSHELSPMIDYGTLADCDRVHKHTVHDCRFLIRHFKNSLLALLCQQQVM